ncbi:MAG: alpha/beta hydrolase [Candidatus Omnitrophica bacterium]|nr:alpha/beta hydrolase [Candidatus Omnitrophota bacterium]
MKIFVFIVSFILFLVFYTRYIEKRSIFFPFKEIEVTPQDIGLGFEEVNLKTPDGENIHGWYVPAGANKKVLLFLHGNGGNISHRLEKIAIFNEIGITTFIIDYRGYGRSTGRPTEDGIYLDAHTAYNYLVKEKGITADEIIVFGESLGAQAAIDLAGKERIAALIIEAAFTSAKDMARAIYPFLPTIFLSVRFDSAAKIPNIDCHKLIIHSRNDEIVPFKLGKKLYEKARQPKEFLEIIGAHNNAVFDSKELFAARVKEFINKL